MRERTPLRLGLGALAALALAGLLVRALWLAQAPPEGPEPVAWDREPCARCRMLLSERAFAAQLQTRDGRVLFFDDPGCLLLYRHEHRPEVHAIYFRDLRADRWIPAEEAVFVPASPTPMGYGLGVVARGEAPGLDAAAALEQALAREARRGARP